MTSTHRLLTRLGAIAAVAALGLSTAACGANAAATATGARSQGKVVIYTNADDEAVTAFKHALDNSGFAGKYVMQGFGTSELGGKLLAEGTGIEADLITMSSYYVDSVQTKHHMFATLTDVKSKPLDASTPDYRRPTTSQEGAIFTNTEALKAAGLQAPTSVKDLADPQYQGQIAFPDMEGSSTGWLMVQDIIGAYGEGAEGQRILTDFFRNAGPHAEQSDAAPLKDVRSGETAIGFGLRHQAAADKAKGLPIDFVDPSEGNYSLTESVAVIDKGATTKPDAQKMAAAIIDQGRAELIKTYPNPLYEGEQEPANHSAHPKTFGQPLTADLLQQHLKFSEAAKRASRA
ncbi:extracellular solute-binding protein [Bifidobacterium pullorum subsp. saeculare]|uniref:Extracellular solute-binding protein n=1 Tax=Bifidobacterium pullorum subsp. saeculare TaxID=78257 RepID=A0A938WV61_9BIFI|nr:extracellular solute-binding protein [Bifidobacterium pullorum]MBM6698799.1 extracellular solute-binding protein [Bifidobacterium pullorum subsp. saeculare]